MLLEAIWYIVLNIFRRKPFFCGRLRLEMFNTRIWWSYYNLQRRTYIIRLHPAACINDFNVNCVPFSFFYINCGPSIFCIHTYKLCHKYFLFISKSRQEILLPYCRPENNEIIVVKNIGFAVYD